MKKLTLNILLTILFILIKQNIFGQVLYEPLMLTKVNFLEINFDAKDEYCLYSSKPKDIIENPEFRASFLQKHKVKSIKHTSSSSIFIEFFDNNGHLIKQESYVNQSLVSSTIINNHYNKFSFLTKSTRAKINFKSKEVYEYNSDSNLIKYIETNKFGFLKRKHRSEQIYKYDTLGNLTEIQGIKEFSYNESGKLRLLKEINIYGERFSKINRRERKKGKYGNRQFKEYYYNSNGLLELIEIKHFDSISYKNYKITFDYDDLDQLIKITKYHGSGEKWKVNQLEYSDGYLIANYETMYHGTSDSYTTVTSKYYYENGLIKKSEKLYSNDRIINDPIAEIIYYEYTFY